MAIACGRKAGKQTIKAPVNPVVANPRKDSTARHEVNHTNKTITATPDTLMPFVDLEPQLRKITKADYQQYKKTYRTACALDSSGFIEGSGLSLEKSCDEICQDFLKERKSGKEINLYSDFDEGILGLRVSPSCKRFITYSSVDKYDYNTYYTLRALIVNYRIVGTKKPLTVKGTVIYTMTNLSIEEVTWIDDKSIALKLYSGDRTGDGSDVYYEYFKAVL